MAAETGFMIDGTVHEIPAIDTFNTDEIQVLYDYSGIGLEDFSRPEDFSDEEFSELFRSKTKNPGFLRALMHVAYQRANPRQNPSRVKAVISQTKMIAALEHLTESGDESGEDTDGRPPASTTELEPSSPKSSVVSNENSGDASPTTSDGQADPLVSTTTPGSGTSSTSGPETSAA